MKTRLSGNEAASKAYMQMKIDVLPAFPITPSTEIPEYYSRYVANGLVDTEFITVESEHSAMSAAIGASLSGARTATATSSNGLAYMWEMLHIASSMRAPIIMNVVCRAISGPLNIHNDHSDAMGMRDTGWIMLFSKNNQEVYDNNILGTMIAERKEVQLPVAICQDGFITSHSIENIEILEDEKVRNLVGEFDISRNLLSKETPITAGPLDLPGYLFEHKKLQVDGLTNAEKIFYEEASKIEKETNRKINMVETYMCEDADSIIIALGSTVETIEEVVKQRREKGEKVGVLTFRLFRPFPKNEFLSKISNVKEIAVMDKVMDYSLSGGNLFKEVVSAITLNDKEKLKDIKIKNYIYGIGGRDVSTKDIEEVFEDLKNEETKEIKYIGLRKEGE